MISAPTPARPPVRSRGWVLVAAVGAGLGAVAAALLLGGGAPEPPPAGIPDPGALTGWALPALRMAGHVLALTIVAALLAAMLPARSAEVLPPGPARRRLVVARGAAVYWASALAVQAVFLTSDLLAARPGELRAEEVRSLLLQSTQGRVILVQGCLLLIVALLSWRARGIRTLLLMLVLTLVAEAAPAFAGHSAASGGHDLAVISLVAHIVAVSVWVGGVAALWWLAERDPQDLELALSRFSGLAAVCLTAAVLSGLANTWVRLSSPVELLTTGYGLLLLGKALLLTAVAGTGLRIRRRVRPAPGTSITRSMLARVTAVEIGLMSVAIGLGVALSRTPTPAPELYTTSGESLLGGPVPPPPTVTTLLFSWTPSGIGLLVVVGGLASYLTAVQHLRRRGVPWPLRRTVSWLAGIAVVAYATLGGLGWYSHAMFSAHMGAHMLLSMVAPALLVLGAPITLALRVLPTGPSPGVPGYRQLLMGLLASRGIRLLTNPILTTTMFVVNLYAVYFTDLFGWLMGHHLGHAWMELHFLIVGFLFFDTLIGVDPLPRRPPHLARLGLMLVAVPFHAFFSVTLMGSEEVVGGDYYAALDRGFATDLIRDQYVGGALAWAVGEIPMLIVAAAVLAQWLAQDRRDARRHDRNEDRDPEQSELSAYNDMLRRLAAADRSTGPGAVTATKD